MYNVETIYTDRLILRKFELKDINDFYEYRSDEETVKYMAYDALENIEQAERKINNLLEDYVENRRMIWAIEIKETGKMIGAIEFVYIFKESNGAELGYALNSKYWNRGYAKEASKAIIKFAFEKMNLVRVYAKCLAINVHSADVMRSVGMTFEGIGRKNIYRKGCYHDVIKYAIIDDDYFKNKE